MTNPSDALEWSHRQKVGNAMPGDSDASYSFEPIAFDCKFKIESNGSQALNLRSGGKYIEFEGHAPMQLIDAIADAIKQAMEQ